MPRCIRHLGCNSRIMMTPRPASEFTRRDDGTTAIFFALALLPIMIMFAFAIDFQRATSVKSQIQASADAAALAGARQYSHDSTEVKAVATAYFNESIQSISHGVSCDAPSIITKPNFAEISVTANCSIPTTISGIIGAEDIKLSTVAVAQSKPTKLDLALMLDVSGSMRGQKLKDLKTAAKNAVDILTENSAGETRISLAPYSTSVNLGGYTESVVGPSNFNKYRAHATCVTERSGKAKKTDAAPGKKTWVGYETKSRRGKSIWCPKAEVLPLTSNARKLKKQIDKLKADGWTAGQLGIAWSWYTISPEWKNVWPAKSAPLKYGDPDVIKSVILMTDGSFNTTYDKDQGNSVNQSKVLCKQMRDADIQVYSVAFKAPAAGQKILKDCASSNEHYFEPENGDELIGVYEEIATSLSQLRLTN